MSVNAEVADVMRQVRERIVLHIEVDGDPESASKILEQQDAVDTIDVKEQRIIATLAEGAVDYSDLSVALVNAGKRIKLFREEEVNLESAFMALTKGMGAKH